MKKIKEIALNLNLELNKSFCRILLPKNFDLNKAVIQCYPKWKSKKRRHKLMILLSTIYLKSIEQPKSKYIQLGRTHMEYLVGWRYTSGAIKILKELGLIESKGKGKAGSHYTGFRINPKFEDEFEWVTIWNPLFAAKLRQLRDESNASLNTAQLILQLNLSHVEAPDNSYSLIDMNRPKAVTQLDWALMRLYDRPSRVSIGRKSGRAFHGVTALKKAVRRSSTIDGEPIAEVDVKSCQPFLLLMLYKENCDEMNRYMEILKDDIYQFINSRLNQPYKSRKDLKEAFLTEVLFSDNYFFYEQWQIFAAEFPILAREIGRFKGATAKARRGSGSRFAIHLQKLESKAVIETAIPRLHEMGIIAISIHDALMCRRSESEIVRQVLIQSVEDVVGFTPIVEIETKEDWDAAA